MSADYKFPEGHVVPVTHFVDEADSENTILVVSAPLDAPNAVFGGLLVTRAKHVGIKAAIISGNCRDVEELDDIGLPVFARGNSILGAAGFTKVAAVNVPVEIEAAGLQPCQVSPGDLIVGDVNGVICVRQADIHAVLEKALELKAADERCMDDLKKGARLQDTLKKHRG